MNRTLHRVGLALIVAVTLPASLHATVRNSESKLMLLSIPGYLDWTHCLTQLKEVVTQGKLPELIQAQFRSLS